MSKKGYPAIASYYQFIFFLQKRHKDRELQTDPTLIESYILTPLLLKMLKISLQSWGSSGYGRPFSFLNKAFKRAENSLMFKELSLKNENHWKEIKTKKIHWEKKILNCNQKNACLPRQFGKNYNNSIHNRSSYVHFFVIELFDYFKVSLFSHTCNSTTTTTAWFFVTFTTTAINVLILCSGLTRLCRRTWSRPPWSGRLPRVPPTSCRSLQLFCYDKKYLFTT